MAKLVPLERRKVMKILKNNGFIITREGGKHAVMEKQDEISIGVVQEIIKQTGKDRKEFY